MQKTGQWLNCWNIGFS